MPNVRSPFGQSRFTVGSKMSSCTRAINLQERLHGPKSYSFYWLFIKNFFIFACLYLICFVMGVLSE